MLLLLIDIFLHNDDDYDNKVENCTVVYDAYILHILQEKSPP